ncbi:hypothetical protein [Eudoraea chungangensis]|uniref:hypothetical protein n=1 Tax=Eudoraea chungangensis TaxID=1481905 RepID=UPI0023ECF21A|nr:hypothetical protein [Eudoraea chungangensis]
MQNYKRNRLGRFKIIPLLLCALMWSFQLSAQEMKPSQTVFKNVRVFDGKTNKLSSTTQVLVEGNMIKEVSSQAGDKASKDAVVIDGEGLTLMPGLSDTHVH